MTREVLGLFGMTLSGAVAVFVRDIFKALKTASGAPYAVLDIFFWLIITVGFTAALVYFNGGEIRGYSIIGACIGAILYFLTISHLVTKGFTVVFVTFFKFLQYIFKILLTPGRFLYKILYKKYSSVKRVNENENKEFQPALIKKEQA